ncbi:hypothetical protein RJT34_31141 [Clitoria ternatea]|uniref:C3H1-type domain-containing protein n=1 Tax=Clitoria ternatea TaxID=43366 RepID=A0AAN9ETT2_CLITE
MVERKQFKTKLCVLYQRGRCTRHNCSFAHGSAELRRFSNSYSAECNILKTLRDLDTSLLDWSICPLILLCKQIQKLRYAITNGMWD